MAIASMPSATRRWAVVRTWVGSSGRQHVAVAIHAFRYFEAMAARHEWVGELQEQVVDVVALLGAHLEDVAEAARGDQAEAGAAALDQGVGDQGGAVHDVADVGERQVCRLQQFGEALQRADRRVLRGGQALVQADVVALRVEQDEVGEGAADVETDAIAVGGGHSGVLAFAAAGLCAAAEGASTRGPEGRCSCCAARSLISHGGTGGGPRRGTGVRAARDSCGPCTPFLRVNNVCRDAMTDLASSEQAPCRIRRLKAAAAVSRADEDIRCAISAGAILRRATSVCVERLAAQPEAAV